MREYMASIIGIMALSMGVLAGADESTSARVTFGVPAGRYKLEKSQDDKTGVCASSHLAWKSFGDDEVLQLGSKIIFAFKVGQSKTVVSESYGKTIRCTNESTTEIEAGRVVRTEIQVCDDGQSIKRPVEVTSLEAQGDRLVYHYSRKSNDQIKWPNLTIDCEFSRQSD